MAEPPTRAALETLVARALEIARRRAGKTQEDMVLLLSEYQSRPSRHVQRWHDWINRPQSVSSLALLAAAGMAGVPVDVLLSQARDEAAVGQAGGRTWHEVEEPPTAASRPEANYEVKLAQLAEIVARLQDTVETQGELLERIAREALPARGEGVAGEGSPATTQPEGRALG